MDIRTQAIPVAWIRSRPGFHFLGTTDLAFINGPVFCHSTHIPVVCAAASEAEYSAVCCPLLQCPSRV